jgi:hypothetical protein
VQLVTSSIDKWRRGRQIARLRRGPHAARAGLEGTNNAGDAPRDRVARALGLVLDDDQHGIELRVAAGDRLAEVERARVGIDVVVDLRDERARLDHAARPEAIAHLDAHALAADHDRRLREAVEPRGAVAADLVAHERFSGIRREAVPAQAVAVVLAL